MMYSRIVNFINNLIYAVTYFKSLQNTVSDLHYFKPESYEKIKKLEKRIEVLSDRIDTLENFYYSIDELQ